MSRCLLLNNAVCKSVRFIEFRVERQLSKALLEVLPMEGQGGKHDAWILRLLNALRITM